MPVAIKALRIWSSQVDENMNDELDQGWWGLYEINSERKVVVGFHGSLCAMWGIDQDAMMNPSRIRPFIMSALTDLSATPEVDEHDRIRSKIYSELDVRLSSFPSFDAALQSVKISCPKCGSDYICKDGPFVSVGCVDKESLEICHHCYECGHNWNIHI